jgi:hypothetical protein
VLLTTLLLGVAVCIAWLQYKRYKHQRDMLQAMSVPFEGFSMVVQQQAASTNLLGTRIEDMGRRIGTMADSIDRLSTTMERFALGQAEQAKSPTPHYVRSPRPPHLKQS